MAMVYQIANWSGNFENAKSRQHQRLRFVCVPNKLSGLSLRRLLALPDGIAIYGFWHLILAKASQQTLPRDGWLTENGRADGAPWSVEDLVLLFATSTEFATRALDVLASPSVGWLLRHDLVKVTSAAMTVTPGVYRESDLPVAGVDPRQSPVGHHQDTFAATRTTGTNYRESDLEQNRTERREGRISDGSKQVSSLSPAGSAGDETATAHSGNGGESTLLNDQPQTDPTPQPLEDRTAGAQETQPPPVQDPTAIDIENLAIFVNALRLGPNGQPNMVEANIARILKWLLDNRLAWVRHATWDEWRDALALALLVSELDAQRKVRDCVSYFITLFAKRAQPYERHVAAAGRIWSAAAEREHPTPPWMRHLLAPISRPVRRTAQDVLNALGVEELNA